MSVVVNVNNGGLEKALKRLKRCLAQSGHPRKLARQECYMKPPAQRRADHRHALK
jgi:ribosomal protein S21